LESIIAGAVIYSFIKLTMRREGKFGYMRFLWLLAMLLTALLPLFNWHFGILDGTKVEEITTLVLPEATITQDGPSTAETAATGSSLNIFLLIYLIGAAASLLLCVFWLFLLWRKIRACHEAGTEEANLLESLKNELGISCKTRLPMQRRLKN
jgi:beta-lactamase regulating signal transducer with metallopeptidase domain